MILTKQLQVVIESSLAQGRDYDDIREILLKQGFQDADINELFAQYRGNSDPVAQKPPTDTDLGLVKTQTSTPPVAPVQTPKEQLFNKDFVHPEVKPGFVPVGFESTPSPQSQVKEEIQTFMNVGTNTQTAANRVAKEESVAAEEKLPAPGTVNLPNEFKQAVQKYAVPNSNPEPTPEPITQTKSQGTQMINVGFGGMPEIEKVLAEENAKKAEKSPWPLVIVLVLLIAIFGGFAYAWFFIFNPEPIGFTEEQEAPPESPLPPEPTGPRDPFTNQLLETN